MDLSDAVRTLKDNAPSISDAIFGLIQPKGGLLGPRDGAAYCSALRVGTCLRVANEYLCDIPSYWIDDETEGLCTSIVELLDQAVQCVQKPASPAILPFMSPPSRQPRTTGRLGRTEALLCFFRTRKEAADVLAKQCAVLCEILRQGSSDAPAKATFQRLGAPEELAALDGGGFEALKVVTECNPTLHETDDGAVDQHEPSSAPLRHTARLCLHQTDATSQLASRYLTVLVSTRSLSTWQEFCVKPHPGHDQQQGQEPLGRGGLCTIVDGDYGSVLHLSLRNGTQVYLEVRRQSLPPLHVPGAGRGEPLERVLADYQLEAKHKVLLAYAIARSYYQFYDSDLMRVKWTSKSIWFMPAREQPDDQGQQHQLPLRAYLTFPFDMRDDSEEYFSELGVIHKFPRMLDIGVLLLEIGLATPLKPIRHGHRVHQLNFTLNAAGKHLKTFERDDWGGFKGKKVYDAVVKYCLTDGNFDRTMRSTTGANDQEKDYTYTTDESQAKGSIHKRRTVFYDNVVAPLEWLAKKGFQAQTGDIPRVDKKEPDTPPPASPATDRPFEMPRAPDAQESARTAWLNRLKAINQSVAKKQYRYQMDGQVRVAVLDTGINEDLAVFSSVDGLLDRVVGYKDFVSPGAGDGKKTDDVGHGTFMARLVMECAPNAQILAGRVARSTDRLETCQDNIAEAIRWAGLETDADIISMSFGFPQGSEAISDAIDEVYRHRKGRVIFFAAAGNLSSDMESFPAHHQHVISVHATDGLGDPLPSTPMFYSEDVRLGTYGGDVPRRLERELQDAHAGVCQPGSSVATAVMASVGATLLAQGAVLAREAPDALLPLIRTKGGMEAVLRHIAGRGAAGGQRRPVRLDAFWK